MTREYFNFLSFLLAFFVFLIATVTSALYYKKQKQDLIATYIAWYGGLISFLWLSLTLNIYSFMLPPMQK